MDDHGRHEDPDRAGTFLDAEAAAQELLQRLKKLEVGANRYLEAAQHLEASTDATREMTAAIRDVGQESQRFFARIDQMERANQARMESWAAEQRTQRWILERLVRRTNLGIGIVVLAATVTALALSIR